MSNASDQEHPLHQAAIAPGAGQKSRRRRKARKLARAAVPMPAVPAPEEPQQQRVVEAPLQPPTPAGGLVGVFQRPWLLRLLVRREMAKRYSASLLGLLWSYIQPAIRFTVYYFVVIGLIRQHESVPQFALHLFCGIVFTHYFSETASGGTRSIWANRSLVGRTALPREAFPVSSMLTAALHTLPQLVLLAVVCALVGWTTDMVGIVSGLLGLAIVVTFSMAVALFFSAVNVYYRDFQNIVSTLTQFMHFMVPMMYPVTRVMSVSHSHPVIYQIYMANPVADAVILLQRFFWHGSVAANHQLNASSKFPPHMLERGAIMLVVCLILLWIAQKAFTRLEVKFPERL